MTDSRIPIVSVAGLKREFTRYLPTWFIYFSAVGLLHAYLANFPEEGFESLGLSRMSFAPTILFPLVWFVGFFVLRIRNSSRLVHRYKAYLSLAFLAVIVPMVIVLLHVPHPLSHDQLTDLFEVGQLLWVGLFMVNVMITRGRHAFVLFFGVTFIYGLVLENAGIVMGFFYEPGFTLYLGPLPAPLCTMLGWCLVFYVTVAVVEQLAQWVPRLGATAWHKAFLTTILALSLDAQLDPLASMSGVFWRWNELLPPAFLGVPVINFAAWFGAFLPFSYFLYAVQERKDLSAPRRNYELFLRVAWASVLGGCLCFGVMAVIEGGFDGPTFRILGEFADRLAPY